MSVRLISSHDFETPGRPRVAIAIALLLALLLAPGAWAAGFAILDQSIDGIGRASAGESAIANDPSTVFANPAGMTYLEKPEILAGTHIIRAEAHVKSKSLTSVGAPGVGRPQAPTGGRNGDPLGTDVLPVFAVSSPVWRDRVWAGFSLNVPWGLSSKYTDGWAGRYDSTKSELLSINLQPSMAVRVTDWLSLGVGLNVQYVEAELESALPNVAALVPLVPSTDGKVEIDGDDWSVGYNLGVILEHPEWRTRVGFHYRSEVKHSLEGNTKFKNMLGGLSALNGRWSADADLDVPAVYSLSVVQPIGEKWNLLATYRYVGWQSFDEILVKTNHVVPQATRLQTKTKYDDSFNVAVGASYAVTPEWDVRGGIQYDQTPTRGAYRDTRVPDGDRWWIALGTTWRWKWVELQASWTHMFFRDSDIDRTNVLYAGTGADTNVRVKADIDAYVDIVSLAFLARF